MADMDEHDPGPVITQKTRQTLVIRIKNPSKAPAAPKVVKGKNEGGRKRKKGKKGREDGPAADSELKAEETAENETEKGERKAAFWSDRDTNTMLQYLVDNKSKAGDGGNFTMALYNGAAAECNKVLTQGALKTGLSCKNKFSKVCCDCLF